MSKKNAAHLVTVGDIFTEDWGYDQTNVDFYQVVKVNARTVRVRPIADERIDTGNMTGRKTPTHDAFTGPAVTKTPFTWRDFHPDTVYLNSRHGSCQKWDGRPKSFSSYA